LKSCNNLREPQRGESLTAEWFPENIQYKVIGQIVNPFPIYSIACFCGSASARDMRKRSVWEYMRHAMFFWKHENCLLNDYGVWERLLRTVTKITIFEEKMDMKRKMTKKCLLLYVFHSISFIFIFLFLVVRDVVIRQRKILAKTSD